MYFDDLPVGYSFETEGRTLSEDDILAFARQWDRQYFHTDPEAAMASPYGGLIASGFHTMLTALGRAPSENSGRGITREEGG